MELVWCLIWLGFFVSLEFGGGWVLRRDLASADTFSPRNIFPTRGPHVVGNFGAARNLGFVRHGDFQKRGKIAEVKKSEKMPKNRVFLSAGFLGPDSGGLFGREIPKIGENDWAEKSEKNNINKNIIGDNNQLINSPINQPGDLPGVSENSILNNAREASLSSILEEADGLRREKLGESAQKTGEKSVETEKTAQIEKSEIFAEKVGIQPTPFLRVSEDTGEKDANLGGENISKISPPKEIQTETHKFQAEVSKVMDIIINSLYTQKDIFLRELVSNAADAAAKKTHHSPKASPQIRIKADRENRILTVEDDGIGMSKEELVRNLGTIAQSGTSKFVQEMSGSGVDSNLIGQFGVGFYSAYLVADCVEVVTKRAFGVTNEVWRWKSESAGAFTVSRLPTDADLFEGDSGTKIFLHLKEDCDEYLEDYKIKDLLRKYSEFTQFPIKLWTEKIEYERIPAPGGKKKTVTKKTHVWEHINTQPPIWRQAQNQVSNQDYHDFYKTAFKVYDDPLAFSHFAVEGQVDFCSVLYIPGTLPFELSKNMFDENSRGIRLYVRRVFINDKFTDSLPRWLKFVRGVVDSEELPLNVGREILQRSRLLEVINGRIAQKAIDMIKGVRAEGGDKWRRFISSFGKYLKVGVVEDKENQEQLASLCQFHSTGKKVTPTNIPKNDNSPNNNNIISPNDNDSVVDNNARNCIPSEGTSETTLDEYISRMEEGQKNIYYVAVESIEAAKSMPTLEKLKALNYEVLYSLEPIDEFALSSLALNKYRQIPLLDANQEDLQIPQQQNLPKQTIPMHKLCEKLGELLKGKVERVEISDRLTDSAAVLLQGSMGLSPSMQRYMKQQASSQGMAEEDIYGLQMNQAVLQINPSHQIIQHLNAHVGEHGMDEEGRRLGSMVYHVSALRGGYSIKDPNSFASEITFLMCNRATAYFTPQNTQSTQSTQSTQNTQNIQNMQNIQNTTHTPQNHPQTT